MINDRMDRQLFYDRVFAEYKQKDAESGGKTGVPILTQADLRLEQFLTNTISNYTFPVLTTDTTQNTTQVLPTEQRLQTNDNFHIYSIGMYLATTVASTDTAFRLWTNPNEIALLAAATALDYLKLWNSRLNINVNQVDVLTNWNTSRHFRVGQTQRLSAAANQNFDEMDLSKDGIVPAAPGLMLSGAYTNTITLTLPAALTTALAANNSRWVMIFSGLRAQNAAVRKGGL